MPPVCREKSKIWDNDIQKNIALNKPSWQSKQYEYYPGDPRTHASNGVDGFKKDLSSTGGQCVISGNNLPTATWWVNLTSILSIHHITIYYRTENIKWGCPTSGYFGPDCSLRCHTNCQEYCNIETGVCLGCKPGYVGQYCDKECSGRRFGQNCEDFCGDCLDFEQCHHVNGKCQNGCERGYQGTRCTEMCPIGFYDKSCEKKCSPNCLYSNRCDSKSGVCQGGCKTGWEGVLCDKDCNKKNGTNCNIRCGHCRGGAVCNQINGVCPNGCAAGYMGESCTRECDSGWYGLNCKQKCSAYCNDTGVCDHVTGSCKDGCKSGWQGVNCFEDCEKSLTVESGNQKEKMYDTLGSNTSRADEKEEEIDMPLQTA
ncbi:multiple epidermal growth factor-like domains protein 10 [Saccostrea cucullata]|uniref:multiple epidermal growth factor-like domains protein 10 n=1 Tax=Saccostrea cuccullata TaxID=36930 RepID=UPI002ED0A481